MKEFYRMALVYKDRVRQQAYPNGTGPVELTVAVDSYITFSQSNVNDDSFPYLIISGNLFEIGIGTFTSSVDSGTTYGIINRNTVLSNSSFNTDLISFSGGLADCIITNPSDISVLVSARPSDATNKLLKWVGDQYQLVDPVLNSSSLGTTINDSVMTYNSSSENYQAFPDLKYENTPSPFLYLNGIFQATAKSFKIKHPIDSNKYLIHGSLEGPEFGIYTRGTAFTHYKVSINLPEYFNVMSDNCSCYVSSDSFIPHKSKIENGVLFVSLLFPSVKKVQLNYLIIASRNDIPFTLEEHVW